MAVEREQIDDAAAAFQNDLSGGTPRQPVDRGEDGRFLSRSGNSAEQLFQPRQLADDEDIVDPDDAAASKRARTGPKRGGEDGEEDGQGLSDGQEGEDGEGEGEDGEGDGEEDGEEAGTRTQGPDLDLETRIKVNVDGKPKEVSLGEAIRGYIRTDTFHQRLQEVDNERQTVRNDRAEVTKAREVYSGALQRVMNEINAFASTEPNWDAEFDKDPVAASKMQRQWQKLQQAKSQIEQQQAAVAEDTRRENQRAMMEFAAAERRKLRDLFPQWTDSKVWDRDKTNMMRTAKAAGFSDEEVNQILDHRYIRILHKAARYDRIMRKRPHPVPDPKTPVRNGARQTRRAQTPMTRAQSRLAQSGSVHDAAAVFGNIIDSE